MLFDRACAGGGWNAGNGVAFGVPLEPHADVTSLALIALLPHRNHPTVQASLSWLKSRLPTLNSLNSVSWTAMALATYGCDTSLAVEKLVDLASTKRQGAKWKAQVSASWRRMPCKAPLVSSPAGTEFCMQWKQWWNDESDAKSQFTACALSGQWVDCNSKFTARPLEMLLGASSVLA